MGRNHRYSTHEVEDAFVEDCCMVGNVEPRLICPLYREIIPLLLGVVVLMEEQLCAHLGVNAPC